MYTCSKTPCSAHTVHLSVLYGSQHKQQVYPFTALAEWFL